MYNDTNAPQWDTGQLTGFWDGSAPLPSTVTAPYNAESYAFSQPQQHLGGSATNGNADNTNGQTFFDGLDLSATTSTLPDVAVTAAKKRSSDKDKKKRTQFSSCDTCVCGFSLLCEA